MRLTTEQSLQQVKQHIQKLQAKFLKLVKILHVKHCRISKLLCVEKVRLPLIST